jgi:mannose-1-phosphate guanylyltransferase / phosphomannomutase
MSAHPTDGIRAVIIAGGPGTRARAMTGDRIPKALLPVAGIPIAFRQLAALAREGVNVVTVLAGHLGSALRCGIEPEAARLGLDLEVLIEDAPLGTAGCLTSLRGRVDEPLLVVYGDILFDLALAPLLEAHRLRQAILTIVAHPNDHPDTSDLLVVGEDGLVSAIIPVGTNPHGDRRNLVPAGIYLAAPEFIDHIRANERADMIKEVLPRLIGVGARIAAYNTPEYLRDVGTPKRRALAEQDIAAGRVEMLSLHRVHPAIFLDVDGVLSEEIGGHGVLTPEAIRLTSQAGAAVGAINKAGALAIAVTNRPQLAKGLITRTQLDAILGRLEALLASAGGVLDRIYFCPHHTQSGFAGEVPELKIACDCRKPAPGLLLRAAQDLPIDMSRSAMIGDSLRDIGAAHLAGIPGYGVRTGYGCRDREAVAGSSAQNALPDLMFDNVAEAVDFALRYEEIARPVVAAIERLVSSAHSAPMLISLSGRSRTGKSALADALARTFSAAGRATLIVPLDQWIKPLAQREPTDTAEERNQVHLYRDVLSRLKSRGVVTAPGYEAATRGAVAGVRLDASNKDLIIVDGVFAAQSAIRDLVDCSVHVIAAEQLEHVRFASFCRWKGLSETESEALWEARREHEWPLVDAQEATSDLVIALAPIGGDRAAEPVRLTVSG